MEAINDATRQTRHQNFKLLLERFKGQIWKQFPDEPNRGMLMRFAQKIGVSQAYVSHLNTGYRGVGHALARKIEEVHGLEPGWMDREHSDLEPRTAEEKVFIAAAVRLFRDDPVAAQSILLQIVSRPRGDGAHSKS